MVRCVSGCGVMVLVAAALLPSGAWGNDEQAPPPKPRLNVLLLMADDLNPSLACYGRTKIQSPNVDRIAKRGVRFDRAYCQYPLCNPSRASLLTGLRPDRTEVIDNWLHFRDVRPKVVTLPQFFRKAGYHSSRVGKLFHYGVPDHIGTSGLDDPQSWDEFVNPIGRDVADEPNIFSIMPEAGLGGMIGWLADEEGTDDQQTDAKGAAAAIRILEERAAAGKPFFLGVGFYRPHTPYVSPKNFFAKYPTDSITPAATANEPRRGIPPLAFTNALPNYGMSDRLQRKAIQAYYAAITYMDVQLGKVLDTVDRLGLWENTIVIFTSDHGYHLGEHGLWQKMSLYEESTRVPLIVTYPGIKTAGKACSGLVELVDVYPTLVDLAGFSVPKDLAGKSLKPLLEDPKALGKKAVFTEVLRVMSRSGPWLLGRAVRTERYRYIEWDHGRQGVQLYDHRTDPEETKNLARDPALAKTVAELSKLLETGMAGPEPAAARREN